jgi:beta-galactosidase
MRKMHIGRIMLAAGIVCGAAAAQAAEGDGGGLVPDGKPHKLELRDEQFWLDGQPFRLVAGEIHPGRIPFELWEDRIKKIKAMGLNTVSVYIFWNQIEPKENDFVFTDGTDVRRFIKLCQDNGLWVVLRVGTYVCAEWEFGGYPAWMLAHKGMKLRSDDPQFLAFCQSYVSALGKQVADLQVNHGGPILMTQFENEYGKIDAYLAKLRDIFVKGGFDGQLMTCDHSGPVWQNLDGLPGVLRGYNGIRQASKDRIPAARAANHGMPVFTPELYTGWFDLWGTKLARVSIPQQLSDTQFLLDQKNVSFSYYVVDGGTNFGFMAGSNAGRPMETTYDYDAPIDEMGRTTPKYTALRNLFIKELHITPPPVPAQPKVIEVPGFTLHPVCSLVSEAQGAAHTVTDDVQSMEDLGQNYGFVLYQKHFDQGLSGSLILPVVRDYAWIMIDGKVVGEGMTQPPARRDPKPTETLTLAVNHPGACDLQILVHNLGRTSSPFDQAHSRKGLIEDPTLDGKKLTGWVTFPLPLENGEVPQAPNGPASTSDLASPTLFAGSFDISQLGETYLDMSKWHFGVVWVNGHNLGRFWDVGAARSLYLPSVWEKSGKNEVTVLELGTPPASPEINGVTTMVETAPKPFAPYWTSGEKKGLRHVAGQGDEGGGLQ